MVLYTRIHFAIGSKRKSEIPKTCHNIMSIAGRSYTIYLNSQTIERQKFLFTVNVITSAPACQMML